MGRRNFKKAVCRVINLMSAKMVSELDWNEDVPYGFCPACGSVGLEEKSRRKGEVLFKCSDKICRTILIDEKTGKPYPDSLRTRWYVDVSLGDNPPSENARGIVLDGRLVGAIRC